MRPSRSVFHKVSYANVASTLAVVLALSGTAYAAELANDSVKSKHIKNNVVSTKDLKDGSATGADLAANSIGGAQINEGTLGTVPNSGKLGGLAAAAFPRNGGHVRAAFSTASPLRLNVPGFGRFGLNCKNDGRMTYAHDSGVAGAVSQARASFSDFPYDPPEFVMYNSDLSNNGETVTGANHVAVEHYVATADNSRAVMIRTWGYNDIPNPGCNGAVEVQILR